MCTLQKIIDEGANIEDKCSQGPDLGIGLTMENYTNHQKVKIDKYTNLVTLFQFGECF